MIFRKESTYVKGDYQICGCFAACCIAMVLCINQKGSATMKEEVISSTKTLPGDGEFNVIAEPFVGVKMLRVLCLSREVR